MSPEDLTPAERDQAQAAILRIWLARRVPRGTRRRTDRAPVVKFAGARPSVAIGRPVPTVSGDGRVAHCQQMAQARRKAS